MSLPRFPSFEEDMKNELNKESKESKMTGDFDKHYEAQPSKLPKLDDIVSSDNRPIDLGPTASQPSLPKLPSLEDLNKPAGEDNRDFDKFIEDELSMIENESELNEGQLPIEDELQILDSTQMYEDDIDNESLSSTSEIYDDFEDEDDFVDNEGLDNIVNHDGEDDEAKYEDFTDFDGTQLEDTYSEDEPFDEEDYGFLPTVDLDDDLDGDFGSLLPGVDSSPPPTTEKAIPNKGKIKKSGKGFKELDDESLKKIFTNLKNKIIKPKDKSSKVKPKKENKDKKPWSLGNKNDKDKSEDINSKIKDSKGDKKLNVNKVLKSKALIYIIIFIVSLGAIMVGVKVFGTSYLTIDDMDIDIKKDEMELNLINFSEVDGLLKFTAINNGDMSADFILESTLKSKSLNPFKGEEIYCQSDIIALETGGKSEETLHCEDFDKALRYKIKVDLIEVK